MTVSTFYPDSATESTSVDGYVRYRDIAGLTWDSLHDQATGTSILDDGTEVAHSIRADGDTDKWDTIDRGFFLFDTSALPDGDAIASAVFQWVCNATLDDFTDSLSMTTSSPASSTAIVTADFNQVGTVKQATDILISNITVDVAGPTFNTFTLNATGLGNISKTSITKFGTRLQDDLADAEPTWNAGGERSLVNLQSADEMDAADTRPKLVVTHAAPQVSPPANTLALTAMGVIE